MTDRRDDGERAVGPAPVVAFDHISKTYANGTIALRDVSFSIPARTIHAICGENGAGKSTLMKILFGLEGPTAGHVLLDGQPVSTATRDFAGRHGIGMVHQHFSLIPTLSVTENIILGHEPKKGVLIDRAAARAKVEALSRRYGLAVDPDAITGRLPVAAQQKVEILKALSRDTRVLILDEPTAVLSPPEINELFNRLRDLRDHGITILFISHKLNEVRSLAESVTVLRAGQVAGAARLADVPDNMIMQMVMGRPVWSKLSSHPKIVNAVKGGTQTSGLISREQFLELFSGEGIQDLLIGDAMVNTAKPGQPVNLQRAWGKHIAMLHLNSMASIEQGGITFGATADYGGRIAGRIEDKDIGLQGGVRVRTGERVKELIIAKDVGYFIQNAVQ